MRGVIVGKTFLGISKLKKRPGSTWPGHVALKIDSQFVRRILKKNPNLSIVLVAGTNGKTTTTKLIQEILEYQGKKVFRNAAGANLLNGIASSLIKHATFKGKVNFDVAVFEIDENSLPVVLNELSSIQNQTSIILLNLFRDQLDRYGEVNTIAMKWLAALKQTNKNTQLIVNGDDPMLTYIGKESGLNTSYFGLSDNQMKKKEASHDVDFIYCPNCGSKLIYSKRSYSHLGIFKCTKCGFKYLKTETFADLPNPMFGIYNKYNINAAALLVNKVFDTNNKQIKTVLQDFAPAFGRQEMIEYNGKNVFLLLSKNPTGFNQSIEAVLSQDKNPTVLLLLNDRIPDGTDVSWIWDVDFEKLIEEASYIGLGGDRVYDIGLRVKYANNKDSLPTKTEINQNLNTAISSAIDKTKKDETLYILATYSAMLDTRKILKGKAIL